MFEISPKIFSRISQQNIVLQSAHQLISEDLNSLAMTAFDDKWYDTSIKFFKGAKDLIASKNSKNYNNSKMDQKIKEVVRLHNSLLVRKRERIGAEFKLFPYTVDGDTLTKSKNEPKILKNIDFFKRNESDISEFIAGDKKEDSFRRICRQVKI